MWAESGSGEGMAERGERADHLGDDGGVGVLLRTDLLQVHSRAEKDPRREELEGVVAAHTGSQGALNVTLSSEWQGNRRADRSVRGLITRLIFTLFMTTITSAACSDETSPQDRTCGS